MKNQRSWPFRYKITIKTNNNSFFIYNVTTWFYEEKAIALAVAEHNKKYGNIIETNIQNLSIEKIGELDKTTNGLADIPEGDIADRTEF
jgi:hypothetical protein